MLKLVELHQVLGVGAVTIRGLFPIRRVGVGLGEGAETGAVAVIDPVADDFADDRGRKTRGAEAGDERGEVVAVDLRPQFLRRDRARGGGVGRHGAGGRGGGGKRVGEKFADGRRGEDGAEGERGEEGGVGEQREGDDEGFHGDLELARAPRGWSWVSHWPAY